MDICNRRPYSCKKTYQKEYRIDVKKVINYFSNGKVMLIHLIS